MPTILISPAEPAELKARIRERWAGECMEDPYPEEKGADFVLFTPRLELPIQRKRVPDDLLASLRDGRLYKECAQLRSYEFKVLILEGRLLFTADGHLRVGALPSRWTKQGWRNLLRSVRYVEGMDIEYADDMKDTVEVLWELQHYLEKPDHLSLRVRPKMESSWLVPTEQERMVYWLQGCGGGISVKRASAICKVFPTPQAVFEASAQELMGIDGIGPKTAQSLYLFLHGGEHD